MNKRDLTGYSIGVLTGLLLLLPVQILARCTMKAIAVCDILTGIGAVVIISIVNLIAKSHDK